MMLLALVALVVAEIAAAQVKSAPKSALPDDDDNESVVRAYVKANYKRTFREPNGTLKNPYLVPGGPYDQSWDWDSVFTGLALLDLGSAPYLAGR